MLDLWGEKNELFFFYETMWQGLLREVTTSAHLDLGETTGTLFRAQVTAPACCQQCYQVPSTN